MTAPTNEPELLPLTLDDAFQFACHSRVPCFNQCCRDLNQALMPYDVLRLKTNLNMPAADFLSRYAEIRIGPATGLPVASLRFSTGKKRQCPFAADRGCRVYSDRPASCRTYPLVRLLRRSRTNGRRIEQFALLKEPHCRGFEQKQTQTVRQWIVSQELEAYYEANDLLMDLIALKNQRRPGPLPQELSELVQTALYDLERLKALATSDRLDKMDGPGLKPVAALQDDLAWLKWSMAWIKVVLFGGN
jgi:Fe-S-cluster containining protein